MSKDEVEIEKFLQVQKSENTQHKTKSDLNACKKFCESLKESRAIENIPVNEFDLLFVPFGLESSDRSKPAKCLSPRRGTNRVFSVLLISYLAM